MISDLAAFTARTTDHLTRIAEANKRAIAQAADVVAAASDAGRVVHVAGAGHSFAGVLETFYRAGGLPHTNPLWTTAIIPTFGAVASTHAEREVGSGTAVATQADIQPADGVVIFSSSGINPYPVEIAQHSRERGATVIAVTSVAASRQAPPRAGSRLFEVANIVIDTLAPPGDVTWPPDHPSVAPMSSLANAFIWNAIVVSVLSQNPQADAWRSANTAASGEVNADLLERYSTLIPTL